MKMKPRIQRLVVARKLHPHQPDKKNPNYILIYVTETLDCGHELTVYPGDDEPLVAKRRVCHQCQGCWGSLLLKPKKPARSVRFLLKRKAA